MNSSDISAGHSYKGCSGTIFHIDRVEDGEVVYRVHSQGTRVRMELDAFAALMKHETAKRPVASGSPGLTHNDQ